MLEIRVNTNSLNNLVTNLSSVGNRVLQGGYDGVQEMADAVFSRVQDTVPVDTGATKDSAYIDSEVANGQIRFIIGHGGSAVQTNPKTGKSTDSYSVELHEMLDSALSPKNAEEGRTTKWLEKAVNAIEPDFAQALANHIKGSAGL